MQPWMHPLTRAIGCLLLALACASATAGNVPGTRPAHIAADPGPVENDQAIGARIWAFGIDDGYGSTHFPAIFSVDTGKLH